MKTIYTKVLRSFIHFQEAAGFKLVSASDGEEWIKNPSTKEAVEWATAAGEGTLSFTKDEQRITCYVVIGNEASATVADVGHASNIPPKIFEDFEDAWDAFVRKWDALEA